MGRSSKEQVKTSREQLSEKEQLQFLDIQKVVKANDDLSDRVEALKRREEILLSEKREQEGRVHALQEQLHQKELQLNEFFELEKRQKLGSETQMQHNDNEINRKKASKHQEAMRKKGEEKKALKDQLDQKGVEIKLLEDQLDQKGENIKVLKDQLGQKTLELNKIYEREKNAKSSELEEK